MYRRAHGPLLGSSRNCQTKSFVESFSPYSSIAFAQRRAAFCRSSSTSSSSFPEFAAAPSGKPSAPSSAPSVDSLYAEPPKPVVACTVKYSLGPTSASAWSMRASAAAASASASRSASRTSTTEPGRMSEIAKPSYATP